MLDKKQQLEPNLEQRTGSKLGKEYCLPAFLTYKQSTYEMLGWMTHKLESRLLGEISITLDIQMTPLNGRNRREIKEPLMKEDSERAGLKLHIQKD